MKNLKNNNIVKCMMNRILVLLLGSILGILALILVLSLPTGRMTQNVLQSMPTLQSEMGLVGVVDGYVQTFTGNFTDSLMLENCIYTNEKRSLLEQALFMYRGETSTDGSWAPTISLGDYANGKELPCEIEYSRYWHGYLIFLKPLLYFCNINDMRVLTAYVQLFLNGIILLLLCKRRAYGLGVAYLISTVFLYSPFLYASLSLSICFYLLCGAIIIQLLYNDWFLNHNAYPLFFFLTGMATSYFDFLTYPLVTLGFPLCIYLYLNMNTWKDGICKTLRYSIEWGIGYLGFWMMKWILTLILTGKEVFHKALSALATRTDNADGYSKLEGFGVVVKKNIEVYRNQIYFLIGFFGVLLIIYLLIKKIKTGVESGFIGQMCVFFLAALYPFAWYFVAQNHSDEHWMFTCKILSVSVFAIGSAVAKLTKRISS